MAIWMQFFLPKNLWLHLKKKPCRGGGEILGLDYRRVRDVGNKRASARVEIEDVSCREQHCATNEINTGTIASIPINQNEIIAFCKD
jgi:hypothetical protein